MEGAAAVLVRLSVGVLGLCALLLSVACDRGEGSRVTPAATAPTIAAGSTTSTPAATGIVRAAATLQPAEAAGRGDCPSNWLVVDDAPVSVCIPPDHYAEFASLPDGRQWLQIRLVPGAPVAATPSMLDLATTATYEPPTTCEFEAEQVDTSAQTTLAPFAVAGASGVACTARTSYAVQFKGSVPSQPRPLEFRVYAVTEAELKLAKQILSTIRPR
jgi:hypothetical protein